MLSGMTITCFLGSYLLALGTEIARFAFRARVRAWLNVVFALAGILAHSLFLGQRTTTALQQHLPLFSSWYEWCLLSAWLLAGAYVGLILRHSENAVGLFLLPLVLVLILIAMLMGDDARFSRDQALGLWSTVHGIALLAGTSTVALGFGAGVMYLAQSYRLKNKLPTQQGIRLPTLEWLQRFNRRTLLVSTGLLLVGLISGVALNSAKTSDSIAWTDPVILSSAVLLVWLLAANIFEWCYVPARRGRKIAYLTLASFLFLALALAFVLAGNHASQPASASDGAATGDAP
ncbi:MAG: cytochrome C assembly protein [Planctomycetes bacterium]|nr:cytochrome C assembly protein [Planctomycetota bacterium]